MPALFRAPRRSLSVCWRVEKAPGADHLHIQWRELGGPLLTPPEQRGFGSRLVERGLAMKLGGKAEIAFKPEGVFCQIVILLKGAP